MTAAREVEEESGWRPRNVRPLERIAWIPLASVRERIERGEIVGAASQAGLLQVLAVPPGRYRDSCI